RKGRGSGSVQRNSYPEEQSSCGFQLNMRLLEHCFQDVPGETGILAQTADRIGIPVPSVRDVNAEVMAGRMDDVAEFLVDAKEHLELIGSGRKIQFTNEPHRVPNHDFVVSRDAHIRSISQQT